MELAKILHVTLHTVLGFIAMLAATRVLGKKQMAQLTYFEYVTGITIGGLAAAVALDTEIDFTLALTSLTVWTLLMLFSNWASLKSLRLRRFLDGEPVLLVARGKILEENMARQHYTLDDLLSELRTRDVFSLRDVQFAVLEPSGSLSVIREEKNRATTPSRPLVMDGQVLQENLRDLHLTEAWLKAKLARYGADDLSDVFYAELHPDGVLYVDRRLDNVPGRM